MRRIMWAGLTAFVALLLSVQAAGAVIIVTCRDGNPQAVANAPGQAPQPVDWARCDGIVDGTCHFAIARGGCGCAPIGCCGFIKAAVPVGQRRSVSDAFTRLRLRCRRCPVNPAGPTASYPIGP